MMNPRYRKRFPGAKTGALLFCLAGFASADVIVIDSAGGPGSDFMDLGGLAAAQDGDLVLIRAGTYGGFFPVIDGRGFAIQAEDGAEVRFTSGLRIQNLGPSQHMSVRGIRFDSLGLRLSDCTGPLLFEDCSLMAAGLLAAIDSIIASRCSSLSFSHCDLRWVENPQSESETLRLIDSSVYLFDTHVNGLDLFGGGLSAVMAQDSSLFLTGSQVQGGLGAPGVLGGPTGCTNGGAGGPAVTLLGSSLVQVLHSSVQGGAGGPAQLPGCSDGAAGADFINSGGSTVIQVAGPSPSLVLASPVRAGNAVSRSFSGPAGDSVWFLFAMAPSAPVGQGIFDGTLLLDPAQLTLRRIGTFPASGQLQDSLIAPLIPGLESLQFFAQSMLFSNAEGRFIMGSGSIITLLDPSI